MDAIDAIDRSIDARRRRDAEGSDARIPSFARTRVRAFARAFTHSRVRMHSHSSEGDDDGRLYRVYHGVRSPWYMTQCVVYGHEYRYIENQGYEALGM